MFRRRKTEEAAVSEAVVKEGGKGRPTPSRREAEAAAKARARGVADRKNSARMTKQQRAEQNATIREGMKRGDERYLSSRDKGPVRRFVRDYVDARLCIAELLLPILVLNFLVQAFAPAVASGVLEGVVLLVALDTVWLVVRLRRELNRRWPDKATTNGAVSYGVLRSIQLRFMRLPKTQVKLGTKLPERY